MSKAARSASVPRGGVQVSKKSQRGWRWSRSSGLLSAPIRCKKDQWYIVRGAVKAADTACGVDLQVRFLIDEDLLYGQRVRLHCVRERLEGGELLGWIKTPEEATHLQLCAGDAATAGPIAEVVFHPVSERDAKCHPLANVPRWSVYQPPFALERVLLPASLEGLESVLPEGMARSVIRPRSWQDLRRRGKRCVVILDDEQVEGLGGGLKAVERLASESWVILSLGSAAKLLKDSGRVRTSAKKLLSAHGIMSARVEYSDVATRGFALQDVFPLTMMAEEGFFRMRVLKATRSWKRYADEEGFATLLASETPWPDECGDVLSAARAVGKGELVFTDLPWLVGGGMGPLLAPSVARHALAMHLGGAIGDDVQYWNRWDDTAIVVRDIAELPKRYKPLRAVRWRTEGGSLLPLGISLVPEGATDGARHIVLRTGRIDSAGLHDGVPPEPMMIFMKWLSREWREQTPWAKRHLRNTVVTWQFETALGARYAFGYGSAETLPGGRSREVVLRMRPEDVKTGVAAEEGVSGGAEALVFSRDEGVFGDEAIDFQASLSARLRGVIQGRKRTGG